VVLALQLSRLNGRHETLALYRDGITHIVVEPPDLKARLAALVPPPRMHLTRFHGVFALYSNLRAVVAPAPAAAASSAKAGGLNVLSATR